MASSGGVRVGAAALLRANRNTTPDSVLSQTLTCALCEDATRKLAVWCMDCFVSEKGRALPFALCEDCNNDMHRPAKTALHRRQPFRCNSERMRTAAELKVAALPADLPPLCTLGCSICEQLLPDFGEAQWCQECALILCKECSRDLHIPQKKKLHQRHPFRCRFISAKHLDDENGMIAEASASAASTRPPTAADGSARPAAQNNARATMPIPSSASAAAAAVAASSSSKPGSAGGSDSQRSTFRAAATKVATRATIVNRLSARASPGDIDPRKQNAGLPGDVIQISEPALTGAIECTNLTFKNTFNAFDTLGVVQVVQVCCGNKHAGAVTAGGSLFMWGQNSMNELGVETGDEKEVLEPLIVQIPGNRAVRMLACGFEHSACITMDDCAFSWGSGLMGILGHQADINRETPTQIDLHWNAATTADPDERLVWIAAGPHNTGIVCQGRKDGRQLYTFGAGEYGTLGTGNKIPSLQPQLIHVEDDPAVSAGGERYPVMSKLAFGTNHAVTISAKGACYSFGSNQFGQLGYTLDGQEGAASASSAAATPLSTGRRSIAGGEPRSSAQSGDLQLRPRCVESLRKANIRIKHAACGELSTSLLTDTGAIYSFGSGETHQLGIMDNVDCFTPVKAAVLGGDNAELKAVSLAVGVSSCAAVTESGDVYMWGWSVEAPIPTLVSHLRSNHMQSVAIGAHDNVVCLTGVANEIYEWRFTEEGEHQAESEPKQNRALRGKRLISISVGKGRCAAATAAGVLLEWGVDTRDPDLPEDEPFDPYRPREIRCLWSIAEVACSAEHSVALTREGKVLTWGQGGFGRLGQANDKDYASPTLVESLKEHVVVSIAIGPGNTGVTTREFKAFVCGAGNSGQLGNNDIQPNLAFAQMAALQHVEVIRLAFGNRHILVVTKDGEVWTSGDNGFGQLGLGASAESKYLRPQRVDTLASIPMLEAACGDNVSFVLSRDGRLFAFGAGETNQIPGHQEDVHTPVQIVFPFDAEADNPIKASRVRELSVASINCAALADNGSVFTWGWALGETIQRVDYMYKEGFSVDKVAMGPSYMLFSV